MNILLLGGSNAGVQNGWAAQFVEKAAGHAVENRFLGAVGSLYGLLALLKRDREGAARPDLIVFEYCLNDMLLVEADMLADSLIDDALDAIVDHCARAGVGLLFLCLEPRPGDPRKPRNAIPRVQALYAAAARRGGVSCLWLRDIFAQRLAPEDYQDENHLSSQASARVVDALLAATETNLPPPNPRERAPSRFDYVDAACARVEGPCRQRRLSSRVFEGDFLEISRGGRSLWAGEGLLVGLMLQSNDMSGVYSIRTQRRAFRKNPRSKMQEIVRNLMLLHYTTRHIAVDGEVEIAMPDDEGRLMSLPEDGTLLAAPAIAPFDAQTLDIHGLMFWRPRKISERLHDAFFALARPAGGRAFGAVPFRSPVARSAVAK
jgi:hypothetical protein